MKHLFAHRLLKISFLFFTALLLTHVVKAQQTCNAFVGNVCTELNAMYVKLDSTTRIAGVLGDSTAENTMLKFARDNGINYLIMYDLQGLVANSTRATQLASLISRAKTQYGVQQVGAALAESQFADNIVAYNNSHVANERIDVLNVEREFWRSTTNRAAEFDATINVLNYFKNVGTANNLTTEIYIGWITANEGARLGDAVDRVLVHYYRQNDTDIVNYGIERLQYLAGASRKVKVIPIFSNEGPSTTDDAETYFMGNWLATNPNDKAFKSWIAGYNALTGSWKNNIEVIGSNWFLYNHFPAIYTAKTNHITSNPANQTACTGQSRTFTVASSATTKTYCWLKNGKCLADGGNVSGARTASLTIANITTQDFANYAARVISYDSANPTSFTSTAATLTATASCGGSSTNLALNKTVTASSFVATGYEPAKVVDGDTTTTRWASAYSGSQWIQVDLGTNYTIDRVKLTWEAAYATEYQILVSSDGSNWTTLRSITGNTSLVNDNTVLNGSARYVRINGTAKALPAWGFSLFEFEVYGQVASIVNKALNKSVTASSFIAAGYEPAKVVDGNTTTTRWASAYSGTQWIQVDLGSTTAVSRVKLTWDPAYAIDYQILISTDGNSWTTLRSITGNSSLINDNTGLSGSGRYIRINGTTKALPAFGFSLYELEVY